MPSRPTQHVAYVASLSVIAVLCVSVARAEGPPAVSRRIVLSEPASVPDRDAIMALVELPPSSSEGRHTHPGELFGFVLEGSISLESEGRPTLTLKAGDAYHVLPGRVHNVLNRGTATARTAVVLVAEKGKPPTSELK